MAHAQRAVRSAFGHDRDLEPQARRLAQPALGLRHGAQAARQRDLAEGAHRPERDAARGRDERQRDGEVGRRLVDPHAAGDVDEHVVLAEAEAAVAREHGQQQRQAVAVEAAREPPGHRQLAGRDERLHVDRERARALHGHERAGAGPVEIGAVVQAARVGHRDQAAVAHLEQPDLVGRAEAVLLRPQHAQRAQRIALEHQHDVDEVLEHARPGDDALPSSRARSGRCRCSSPWPGAAGGRPTRAPATRSPARPRAARPRASGSSRRRRPRARSPRSWRRPSRARSRPGRPRLPWRRSARRAGAPARATPRPATSSTGRCAPIAPSIAAVRLDLPTPGSPPSSTSDPGTSPPPSTRSSSAMPVPMRAAALVSTDASGTTTPGLAPWRRAPLRASSEAGACSSERREGAAVGAAAEPAGLLAAALAADIGGAGAGHRISQASAAGGR